MATVERDGSTGAALLWRRGRDSVTILPNGHWMVGGGCDEMYPPNQADDYTLLREAVVACLSCDWLTEAERAYVRRALRRPHRGPDPPAEDAGWLAGFYFWPWSR